MWIFFICCYLVFVVIKVAPALLKTYFKSNRRNTYPNPSEDLPPSVTSYAIPKKENIFHEEFLKAKEDWINDQRTRLVSKMSVVQLMDSKTILEIGYKDLLNCFEWGYSRQRILKRDRFTCRKCSLQSNSLHVHHTFYLKGCLPWEIEDEALIALCYSCHKKEHDEKAIKVFISTPAGRVQTINSNLYCSRCNGAGYFPQFKHIDAGICFKCSGNCIERTIFTERLTHIKNNSRSYSINTMVNDSYIFLRNIDNDYYRDVIDKVYNAPQNDIINTSDDDLPW